MDKEELLKEITKTEEHLATMKKMLEDCEYERWKPKKNEAYYYVSYVSEVLKDVNDEIDVDAKRYKAYNCFRTKKQAELEAEKILVRRQLEDIARRLNKGRKIDWSDTNQRKYHIYISMLNNHLLWGQDILVKTEGTVYCLDMNFYNVAIQEIGQERLTKYLKGE